MSMTVKVTTPPVTVQLLAEIRRAMVTAAEPILVKAAADAPFEPEPRHDVHLNETGFIRPMAGQVDGAEAVAIGFSAFWARWQHEHMDWHHEHGHAKFLELAMVEGAPAWMAEVAAGIRTALTR